MKNHVSCLVLVSLLASTLAAALKIQSVNASGTIYIRADGSIDPPDAHISTVDNVTYTLTSNITSDADGIVVERSNIIVYGNGYALQGSGNGNGFDLSGIQNVAVKNVQIIDFVYGVELNHSSNNVISELNIIGSALEGLFLTRSNNNTISENNVSETSGSGNGIELEICSNNTISFNNVTGNGGRGILLGDSPNNIVHGNNVAQNTQNGIELSFNSDLNMISNNSIRDNYWYGIKLYLVSNNTISENNLTTNYQAFGIQVSSSNIIYHNNFIHGYYTNVNQVQSDIFSTNAWDNGYPSGGNYWSDYNGTDANHDGIGDTPYVIDANNTDHYPLMGTFNSYNVTYYRPPIVPHTCNVTVISNSTISDFVAPIWLEHPEVIFLWFSVSGAEGSNGFCRVSFPTAMMNGTYHVFLKGTEIPYTLLPCSDANTSYLYFNYTHSTQEVTIIPEFPSFLILSLFSIATLLAAIIYRRKRR